MKRMLMAGFALLLTVTPAMTHHSLTADYDRSQPVLIKGKLAAIDWINPHAFFYVDVHGANGEVTRWKFEGATPNMIARIVSVVRNLRPAI